MGNDKFEVGGMLVLTTRIVAASLPPFFLKYVGD